VDTHGIYSFTNFSWKWKTMHPWFWQDRKRAAIWFYMRTASVQGNKVLHFSDLFTQSKQSVFHILRKKIKSSTYTSITYCLYVPRGLQFNSQNALSFLSITSIKHADVWCSDFLPTNIDFSFKSLKFLLSDFTSVLRCCE